MKGSDYASANGSKGKEKYLADKKASESKDEKLPLWMELFFESTASDTTTLGGQLTQETNRKRKDTSWQEPSDDWTEDEWNVFGSLYLENPDGAFDYAARLNNSKAMEEKNKGKKKIEKSATSNFWAGAGHTAGAIASAPLANASSTPEAAPCPK